MHDETAGRDALRRYFEEDLGWGRGQQQDIVFDLLCAAAEAARGGVLLDAGAGHQRYRPFFTDATYIAQEHPVAGAANKGIARYDILADVRTIPLADGCLDAVLSTSALEHLEYPDAFFAEAHRVLRPGGQIFVNVPFAYPEHEIPYDFQRPTRYGLERYFRHAGFAEWTVRPASSSIHTGQFIYLNALGAPETVAGRGTAVRVARRGLYELSRLITWAALRLLDRPPDEATTLPVGWVAVAHKARAPGADKARMPWPDAATFLAAHGQPSDGLDLINGQIR